MCNRGKKMLKNENLLKELITHYEMIMPDYLKPYTKDAVEIFYKIEPESDNWVKHKNIEKIQIIAMHLRGREGKSNRRENKIKPLSEIDFFPGSFFAAEKRITYILPDILKIRMDLFGKQKPPFRPCDYNDAIEWLNKENHKEFIEFYKKNQPLQKNVQKLKDSIDNLIDKLNEIQEWDHGRLSKQITIPIIYKNGLQDELITLPGTKLRRLANVINYHSMNTNFSKLSLLIFFLTGIKPILPSYSIAQETASYKGKTINIKMFRPFNYKEFISLFKYIRNFMPQKKKIKKGNLKVYEFIEKRGGIPLTEKMIFWRNAQKEWNEIYPKDKYTSLSGLRMAYSRIKKKIKSY